MSSPVTPSPPERSLVDRVLHYAAYSTSFLHSALDDFEYDRYADEIKGIETQNEVFVAGLPRSGTTLLLDLLYETGEFATFTYRHMPFIRAPILWSRMSKSFQKQAVAIERAHGDGMEVSFDSPEAFEEVLWLHHARSKFVQSDRLRPLKDVDATDDLTRGMKNSIRKLLVAEQTPDRIGLRYLSKNNANISRTSLLARMFPTSVMVVPFRNPIAHATSLLKQHEQFDALHRRDAFAEKYMAWLGHFDFGSNFKPIDFGGWLDRRQSAGYNSIDFWLEYWVNTYEFVLEGHVDSVALINYEQLLSCGERVLTALAERIGLPQSNLAAGAGKLRAPTSVPVARDKCNPQMLERADALYETLSSKAL